ncbi:methionyl-tRNA formyltransferase [Chitinophaga defluvii]|uniref:Formyltransferase family protein n=1 Tax=Chitinophaga defluvii TaxID=3163343 RepID=A0ABV2TF15_9BACT
MVFHDSILPKYRGFAPLVNMLINGESKIGVTALFATKEYDMGDIISISEQSITYPIIIQTAIQLITRNYNELAVYVMRKIEAGEQISATSQYKKDGSYSVWLDEEDYHIDWNWNAEKIERFVNAKGYPYAGAFTYVEDKLVRIHHFEVLSPIEIENKTPGKVIFLEDGIPTIVCGHGLIKVLTATYEDGTAFLPLSKFRLRFK